MITRQRNLGALALSILLTILWWYRGTPAQYDAAFLQAIIPILIGAGIGAGIGAATNKKNRSKGALMGALTGGLTGGLGAGMGGAAGAGGGGFLAGLRGLFGGGGANVGAQSSLQALSSMSFDPQGMAIATQRAGGGGIGSLVRNPQAWQLAAQLLGRGGQRQEPRQDVNIIPPSALSIEPVRPVELTRTSVGRPLYGRNPILEAILAQQGGGQSYYL
jgi:hypothetical protein